MKTSLLVLVVSSLVAAQAAVPTAIFHGFGDDCWYPGMWAFTETIGSETGAYATCINIGSLPSVFENFETQAENACNMILADVNLQGEFNVLGLSQGSLLARYIVEKCPIKGNVRNMVTLGGPHKGVAKSPHCFNGWFCDIINFVFDKLAYFELAQDWVGPAGYFRDPNDLDNYLKYSCFLPDVNNERNQTEALFNRFGSLNSAMLVMFSNDTMIFPKETAWFWETQADYTAKPVEQTDFYIKDYIGLRALNEAGKVKFVEWEGDHLQFSDDQIKNEIVPALLL